MSKRPATDHPIYSGQYVIPTAATEAATTFVCSMVRSRLPGCMVVGRQRFGKTKAIRQIVADLEAEFGRSLIIVPIQVEFCEDKPSEGKHYATCLISLEHELANVGTTADKKKRFQEAITERVAGSGQRRVVLIYDDAQFLWEHQYGFLMNDFNLFDRKGIKPTYVLVGQDELLLQRKSFILANRQQLVGRFMIRHQVFHGLRHLDDMRVCLESLDVRTEYPEKSDLSYTEFFFPAAFKRGWRLAGHAEQLFGVYDRLRGRFSIPRAREVPMQYFMPVVEQIFVELGSEELLEPKISDQWLEDAILACGYISAEVTDFSKAA
jgi:hypothetical protein